MLVEVSPIGSTKLSHCEIDFRDLGAHALENASDAPSVASTKDTDFLCFAHVLPVRVRFGYPKVVLGIFVMDVLAFCEHALKHIVVELKAHDPEFKIRVIS